MVSSLGPAPIPPDRSDWSMLQREMVDFFVWLAQALGDMDELVVVAPRTVEELSYMYLE